MATLELASPIDVLEERITPLRQHLAAHPLYQRIQTPQHLRLFMESHVFAVWDFMSLLKSLQASLTCVCVPWQPSPWPESRRFINEIVLGEESDLYQGRALSHFELYLEAMHQAGADTRAIESMLRQVRSGSFDPTFLGAPPAARAFVASTFKTIATGAVHRIAAAFTFGREDLIPEMFRGLVRDLNQRLGGQFSTYQWYLERHIEVDGDDHGPLSLRMIADLCGEDEKLWEEATQSAESALKARIALWDGILTQL